MPDESHSRLVSGPHHSRPTPVVGRTELDREDNCCARPKRHVPRGPHRNVGPVTATATNPIAPAPDAAAVTTNYMPNLIGALAASVGIVIGSIGPWASFMAISKNGISGDGVFTLILGLASMIAMFLILSRGGISRIGDRWIGVGACVICLVISIPNIMNVSSVTTEVFDRTIEAQVGWGLWLTALSSAVLCLTGQTVAKQTRRK